MRTINPVLLLCITLGSYALGLVIGMNQPTPSLEPTSTSNMYTVG